MPLSGFIKKQCGRVDDHVCDVGNCHTTCLLHHPIEEYGNCPGVVYCKILPPQNIRFPILRVSVVTKSGEEKLVAPLCRTCAMTVDPFEGSSLKCNHSNDDDRALTGTFTLSEVSFAIKEQNYEMKEIYEVYYYPRYQLSLFHTIMGRLARLKIIKSGYPGGKKESEMTPEEKQDYVDKLKQETGFHDITVGDIVDDPAMRFVATLLMNALIGKLQLL